MVRKGANVDGRWWRMGSPSRERGRCGWVGLSLRRSVGLWVQLWGVESMGLGLSFDFFLYVCFQEKYTKKMRKYKKEKINEIEVLYIYLLVLFSLGHVVVQVAINLYFILFVSHVSIFYLSLNGRDHFNIKSKG